MKTLEPLTACTSTMDLMELNSQSFETFSNSPAPINKPSIKIENCPTSSLNQGECYTDSERKPIANFNSGGEEHNIFGPTEGSDGNNINLSKDIKKESLEVDKNIEDIDSWASGTSKCDNFFAQPATSHKSAGDIKSEIFTCFYCELRFEY